MQLRETHTKHATNSTDKQTKTATIILRLSGATSQDVLLKHLVIIYSLGILLMALRGLSTLTVLMAERLSFSTSRQYSSALGVVDKLDEEIIWRCLQRKMLAVKGKQSCLLWGWVGLVAKQSKGERCRERLKMQERQERGGLEAVQWQSCHGLPDWVAV